MKTAVIYARYSSDSQTEQSIEGQLRVCEEYAQKNEILILDTYIDRAMTGTNDNRPEFQRMLKDSIKKEWNYVLVYKLDRFSRNKYESVIHKKTLKDNGVKLLSAMENIPDTPEGTLMEALLEGFNQYYSEELTQKVKRGMHETRLKGLYQGGGIPYGYKLDGRKLVIDEDKAEIVKYIFQHYADGIYVSQIIKDLTNQGILNKGKPFATNTIYGILKNEKYLGIYKINNEIYDNMYPKIVDDETFDKVRAKSKKNLYGKRSVKTIYLLRNKITCGYCGKPISAECGTSRKGIKTNYYKCIGIKKYQNGCEKTTIRQATLENFVLNEIIAELEKPKFMNVLLNKLMSLQNDLDNNNSTLKMLLREQKQTETALNNIMRAIEQGVINKTTNSRMKDLEDQLELLERKILIEKSKSSVKISREELAKYYKDLLELEPMLLINQLVKEIKLYNYKAVVIFNSPLKTSPDENQGFFYCTTKQMPIIIQNVIKPKMIDMEITYYV